VDLHFGHLLCSQLGSALVGQTEWPEERVAGGQIAVKGQCQKVGNITCTGKKTRCEKRRAALKKNN